MNLVEIDIGPVNESRKKAIIQNADRQVIIKDYVMGWFHGIIPKDECLGRSYTIESTGKKGTEELSYSGIKTLLVIVD